MGATAIIPAGIDTIHELRPEREERAKVLSPSRFPAAPSVDEVLSLPAILLARLPAPPRLGLHVAGVPGVVRVDPLGMEGSEPDDVVFDADEWAALVVAAEADRVWPADLRAFCERKRAEPAWRLELSEALAGAQPDRGERWDLGRVLRRLAASVLSIEL